MNNVKKIFFLIIKATFALVGLLILILFLYTVFLYDPTSIDKKTEENSISKEDEIPKEKDILKKEEKIKEIEKQKLEESQAQEKISEKAEEKKQIKQVKTNIKDGLYITVGNRAITKSDIVNEIKILLILNNETFSEEKRDQLQTLAIQSTVTRNIKQIEIQKNSFLEFSQNDFIAELTRISNRINMDVETLKNICASNDLDFALIEDQIKTELLWNSLIFQIYASRLKINVDEIEEQLNLIQNKEELTEYLISELVIRPVDEDKIESTIAEIKNKIKTEGFKNVAMNLSISKTAVNGGDLGWLKENEINKKYVTKISKTRVGDISEPIFLPEGILFFKVRDTKKIKRDIEEEKNRLVYAEKTKMLQMYAQSHYDKLKRSVAIKFLDE